MDIFPPAYVVLMIISGIIVFELSPLHFLIPNNVLYPFIDSNATNILSCFAVIGISAIAIGIVLYLLEAYIFGNGGLNRRLHIYLREAGIFLRKTFAHYLIDIPFFENTNLNRTLHTPLLKIFKFLKFAEKQPLQISKEPPITLKNIGFYDWMKNNGYSGYYDFFVVRNFVIRGFLLGFEFSFFANLVFLPLCIFLKYFLEWTVVFLLVTFSLFMLFYIYVKIFWDPTFGRSIQPLIDEYKRNPTVNL